MRMSARTRLGGTTTSSSPSSSSSSSCVCVSFASMALLIAHLHVRNSASEKKWERGTWNEILEPPPSDLQATSKREREKTQAEYQNTHYTMRLLKKIDLMIFGADYRRDATTERVWRQQGWRKSTHCNRATTSRFNSKQEPAHLGHSTSSTSCCWVKSSRIFSRFTGGLPCPMTWCCQPKHTQDESHR